MRKPYGALAGVVVLAACGGQSTAPPSAPPLAASHAGASSTQTRAAAAVSEDDAPEGTLPFGTTFVWDDGVRLTVGTPKAFRPSKLAAGTQGFKAFVAYDVTVVNGTAKRLGAMSISSQATAGDRQSARVFDQAFDLPTAQILPGRTLRWREAYGVVKGQPFVVTFRSGFTGAQPMFEFVP